MALVTDTTPYTEIPKAHRDAETQCVRELCVNIPPGTPVVEFFGGMGLLTEVFLDEINPDRLVTCELDCKLYVGLRNQFGATPNVDILHGDALELCPEHVTPDCLASLDFNKYTSLQMILGGPHQAILKGINARYIHLTDCAAFRLHFHWADYTKRFGHPVTDRASYVVGVAPFYYDILGWELTDWRAHRGAFHLLFKNWRRE
jgi:hypothetical protein